MLHRMALGTRLSLAVLLLAGLGAPAFGQEAELALPAPKLDGPVSVEKALAERRSFRVYRPEALSLAQAGQLLWAAQGITDAAHGKRTAPSAMALYLLEVYLVTARVDGLPTGLYHYRPQGHVLVRLAAGDQRAVLVRNVAQAALKEAPAVLVITGKVGLAKRSEWMYLEAGHAAQNVCLQATALGLGTVTMAGFEPAKVKAALKLPDAEQPIYLMPVGRK